ncbi:MAG: hypothetical protein Q9176_004395 [Flavoplaca citrina]
MVSCQRHPQIPDQPCTCRPTPSQAAPALPILMILFINLAITVTTALMNKTSPPGAKILVGLIMLAVAMVEIGIFIWAWESSTKVTDKKDRPLKREDRILRGENGSGEDSPPDYLEVDGGLETAQDDRTKIKELEACVRCLARLMRES